MQREWSIVQIKKADKTGKAGSESFFQIVLYSCPVFIHMRGPKGKSTAMTAWTNASTQVVSILHAMSV